MRLYFRHNKNNGRESPYHPRLAVKLQVSDPALAGGHLDNPFPLPISVGLMYLGHHNSSHVIYRIKTKIFYEQRRIHIYYITKSKKNIMKELENYFRYSLSSISAIRSCRRAIVISCALTLLRRPSIRCSNSFILDS